VSEPEPGDLAELMLAAYRGTIDDEGEGPEEPLQAILATRRSRP
jgi:hypothetical protein